MELNGREISVLVMSYIRVAGKAFLELPPLLAHWQSRSFYNVTMPDMVFTCNATKSGKRFPFHKWCHVACYVGVSSDLLSSTLSSVHLQETLACPLLVQWPPPHLC